MSKIKISILYVFIIMLSFSLLSGCSTKKETGFKKAEAADKNQYLNVTLRDDPRTLDPSKATDINSKTILNDTMEGLTRLEADSTGSEVIKPAGAESWEVSEDGLTWTFHLKKNYWSDGTSVKADDYAYGIKRTLDPKTDAIDAVLLSPIKNAMSFYNKRVDESVVGIKVVDENTLQINLETKCPYFLSLTYLNIMYPQRKDIVEKYGDDYGKNKDSLVYCGPFIIKEWDSSKKITFYKNEKYWDKNSVKLSKVTFNIIRSENERENTLKNSTVDVVQCNNFKNDTLNANKKKIKSLTQTDPTTYFDFFNEKDSIFSNIKIRQAFVLAINREEYIKKLSTKDLISAYSFTPLNMQIVNEKLYKSVNEEPVKKLSAENKECRELLIEGLKELKMDTDASKLNINCLRLGTDGSSKKSEEILKGMYEKNLGITLNVQYADWNDFQNKMVSGQYQIASGSLWSSEYNDPFSMLGIWIPDPELFTTGYSNSDYNDLIVKSNDYYDAGTRKDLLIKAENKLLYENAVISPIAYGQKNIAYFDFVKGVINPMYGSDFDLKYAYTVGRSK